MIDKKVLEEIVYNSPLVLLSIRDKETIDLANNYLPYSTGFELECEKKPTYNEETFKKIPNIIWDSSQDAYEQRYRIPNGINGLICLYNICYHLGNNSLLNMGSGIHYHIDCTDVTVQDLEVAFNRDSRFESEILKELDTWEYGGKYNSRGTSFGYKHNGGTLGNWVRWNGLGTLEFRIGNMSFDYKVLVKQIIHANDIVRRWKNKIPDYNNCIEYNGTNYKNQIDYQKNMDSNFVSYNHKIEALSNTLNSFNSTPTINTVDVAQARSIVKDRSHKLY